MNNIWDEFIQDILKQNKNDLFGIHSDIVVKYQLHKPFKIDKSLFSEIENKLWNNYISKYKNTNLYSDEQIYNDLKKFFEIDFKNYIYQIINDKKINKLFIELTEEDYYKNLTLYHINYFLKSIKYEKKYLLRYILDVLDKDYITDIRKSRRKGSRGTAEFFTPFSIVEKMCLKVPEEDWQDPMKTWLEPCFGNGNFVLAIIYYRILNGIDWKTALKTCYGVELCEDNVAECKDRICEMLTNICEDFNENEARLIMDSQLVCSDFFKWNFEEWRPYTEEEMKKTTKKKKKNIQQ